MTDVAHELLGEVFHRGKEAPLNHVAFDFGESQFDLVEPRRVGGGEVRMYVRVLGQEIIHRVVLCAERLSAIT